MKPTNKIHPMSVSPVFLLLNDFSSTDLVVILQFLVGVFTYKHIILKYTCIIKNICWYIIKKKK